MEPDEAPPLRAAPLPGSPEPPLLDPRGLHALVAVADRGSGAAAAKALGWSAPTVDHHVRRLESALGATLLARSPQGARLTPIGVEVLGQARQLLALSELTAARVRTLQEHGSRLIRIGAFPTAATVLLPELHAELGDRFELEATLDETDALVALFDEGRLDLAVVFTAGADRPDHGPRGALRRRLAREPMCVIVGRSHPLADGRGAPVDLAELAEARWSLSAGRPDPIDALLLQRCADAGFAPTIGMRSDDYAAIVELVAAGLFVALVPTWVAEDAGDRVAALRLAGAPIEREVLLLARGGDAAVARVAEFVSGIAARRLTR